MFVRLSLNLAQFMTGAAMPCLRSWRTADSFRSISLLCMVLRLIRLVTVTARPEHGLPKEVKLRSPVTWFSSSMTAARLRTSIHARILALLKKSAETPSLLLKAMFRAAAATGRELQLLQGVRGIWVTAVYTASSVRTGQLRRLQRQLHSRLQTRSTVCRSGHSQRKRMRTLILKQSKRQASRMRLLWKGRNKKPAPVRVFVGSYRGYYFLYKYTQYYTQCTIVSKKL